MLIKSASDCIFITYSLMQNALLPYEALHHYSDRDIIKINLFLKGYDQSSEKVEPFSSINIFMYNLRPQPVHVVI